MMMSTRSGLLIVLVLPLALGCLGGRHRRGDGDPAGDPVGTEDGDADDPVVDDGDDPTFDDGEPPAEDQPAPDPIDDPVLDPADERGTYPAGPYGVFGGDVMNDYSFLTGSGSITLADVRRDASHHLLLLYLGSASCAYCGVESPELNTIYAADEARGLEIFGVLSDEAGGPPTGDSADRYFRDEHDAQYPYGANEWVEGTLMTDLYPDGNVALPMNFLIDLETMEILERLDGYPEQGGLQPIVDDYL